MLLYILSPVLKFFHQIKCVYFTQRLSFKTIAMSAKHVITASFIALIFFASCNNGTPLSENKDSLKTHPDWIMLGNVYEVNVRQYTPEGTFKAFAKHLDRLKNMGVQTLWFMPINPISKKERKGI